MQTIGSFEAKTHFSALLHKVEQGEHITITKHGHPVAKLVPADEFSQQPAKQTINAIKALRKKHRLGKLHWKDLRDEGRRY